MGHKIAIDFGTTNSIVARWDAEANTSAVVAVPGLSEAATAERPATIPSLLYVRDGHAGVTAAGAEVRAERLDAQRDNRLFRNFKRGIMAKPAPEPRRIDGHDWSDEDAGRAFVRRVLAQLPYAMADIDQLVLTAPVASFEGYLAWLNGVIDDLPADKIRVVDESTAAALGYAVTKPGAAVMVFDFGGGTLDLSLVQLPESAEKAGGFLSRLLGGKANQHAARVVAKAGRIIGGSDVDQWVLADVLRRTGLSARTLGSDYAALLTACETAKIALSTAEQVTLAFHANDQDYTLPFTRAELETLLEQNGFFTALRHVLDKVMHVSRQRGIFREDVHHVLMVGGTSLMPAVQNTLREYFSETAVRADKPFSAVAEGALQVAAGYGLEDYLVHSYGLRYLDADTGEHAFDEIIPMGSRYPTDGPVEVLLGAAHPGQQAMEFVIGEIDTEAIAMLEVKYEGGQAVFVAQANESSQQIVPVNEALSARLLAKLTPPGQPGQHRVKAAFTIDDRRQLRLTVTDLHSNSRLLDNVVVATLR